MTQNKKSMSEKIDNWFVYHPPKEGQPERYEALREGARQYAHLIDELVPDGPDKSAAIRKLRECVHTANAGIACDEVIECYICENDTGQNPNTYWSCDDGDVPVCDACFGEMTPDELSDDDETKTDGDDY